MQINAEKRTLSFSFLDVFFLLLAFLIGSVFFYFATQEATNAPLPATYRIEVETVPKSFLFSHLPEEGEEIFTEEGLMCGTVLDAHIEASDKGRVLVLTVQATLSLPPEEASAWRVETKDFSQRMTVRSVQVVQEAK